MRDHDDGPTLLTDEQIAGVSGGLSRLGGGGGDWLLPGVTSRGSAGGGGAGGGEHEPPGARRSPSAGEHGIGPLSLAGPPIAASA